MKLRDVVRTAVLATNPYWPFSTVNRYPYQVAVKALARLCAQHRHIKSVYLRSGLVERDWVPGISDIDCTVVVDSNLSIDHQSVFLRRFWRQFTALKRVFPMLGEVDVLDDRTIASWSRFGLPGYSMPNWRLVHGLESVKPTHSAETGQLYRDCVNYSLNYYHWYFRGYFAQTFYGQAEPDYLLASDLQRLASKISRSLAHGQSLPAQEARHLAGQTQQEVSAAVFKAMEKATAATETIAPLSAARANAAWAANFQSHPPLRSQSLDAALFTPWRDVIESVFQDFRDRVYVVLKDGLDVSSVAACARGLKDAFAPNAVVMLMSHSTFTYMVHYYEPFEYLNLLRHRKLAFGVDLLPQIAPPNRQACCEFLLGQAPNLLVYPQSIKMHLTDSTASTSGEMASTLERALLLLLYLEHDFVVPQADVMLRECEQRYPEYFAGLRAFAESTTATQSRDRFEIFKRVADDIDRHLTALR